MSSGATDCKLLMQRHWWHSIAWMLARNHYGAQERLLHFLWCTSSEQAHHILQRSCITRQCDPTIFVNPNSSWDILSSSLKTIVPRYANGTSNLFPSAVYTAQWPLSATGEVVQHVSESAVSVLILCHFLVNWENLLELIMIGSPWLLGSGIVLWKAFCDFRVVAMVSC